MSNTVSIGRKGWVGVAIEPTAGIGGNTAAKFIPYTAQTLHNVVDILDDEAAKGIRERAWGSAVARTRGEGDITCILDAENSPYLLYPALGLLSTQTIESGAVYIHTITRRASNPPRTICMNINDTVGTRRYHYGTVNTAEISFSDGWVELTSGILSKAPDTETDTLKITEETVMAFKDAYIYFGATLAEAETNRAAGTTQPLSAFRLTINNNAEAQYVAGNSSPRQISMGQLEIGGDYTLFFEDTTEQSYHEQSLGPQRAMIISFLGSVIGSGTEREEIRITIPKFHLTDRGMDTAPAGFVTENPTFVGDYDSDYGSINIKIINGTSSYTCGTISSSSSSSISSSSVSSSSSSSSYSSSSHSSSSSSLSSSSFSSSSASCS